MNKKQIKNIIIVFLVLVLIIAGLILINKYALNSNNTNVNENVQENISTDKVEEQEEVQPTDSAKLYITCNNKSIAGYEWEGDFGTYYKNALAQTYKTVIDKFLPEIWDKCDTDYFTINTNKYEMVFQYSRYGYAKNDLEFNFENYVYTIDKYKSTDVHCSSISLNENTPIKKISSREIVEGQNGKHIEAYCVNGKWYIFKFLYDI